MEYIYINIGKPRASDSFFQPHMGQSDHDRCSMSFPVSGNRGRGLNLCSLCRLHLVCCLSIFIRILCCMQKMRQMERADFCIISIKLDEWAILPSLIFLGVGAMTDFGPLIANPKSFLLGAAAQFGIFAAYLGAMAIWIL